VKQLERRIQEVQWKVRVRLEDNFDTGGAVSELLLLVKDVHSYIDKCNSVCSFPLHLVPTCPLCSGVILKL
jgi:cysteinyl-tRNA synthetase